MASLLVLSFASLITGIAGSCINGAHLMRRQTSPNFGYHGLNGPANWLSLNPSANQLCAKGRNQTPPNLQPGASWLQAVSQKPQPSYGTVQNVEFKNLGSTIEVLLGTPKLNFEGVDYTLLQFHFHTPSEHHYQKEHYPLEAHFVHERTNALPDGTKPLLVMSFFLDVQSDAFVDLLSPQPFRLFSKVLNEAPKIPNQGQSTRIDSLDFGPLEQLIRTRQTYKYSGSLTTPPCSEGVTWLVSPDVLEIEAKTYKGARKVVKFNSRFIQSEPGQINVLEASKNSF